jgi:membrane protease YdiL (CAAX protease family)
MPWSAPTVAAEVILLLPLLALAFAVDRFASAVNRMPATVRVALPGLVVIPYCLVTHCAGDFRWRFAGLYALLPIILVGLLWYAAKLDPQQRGCWPDFVVLAVLGLVVEFRLLEAAWPGHLRSLNRLILFDTGLYGFLVIRRLTNVGFHFVPQWQDVKTGLRELAFYAPIAVPLGLGLGFLHFHAQLPSPWKFATSWISIFALIAVLEETYFRGWVQNLLERRVGRHGSLVATAVLFGLSHFNKGATHFNWRYVLLATFAGIFYGRAWRENHRLMASAITHAWVDTIWLLWLR